MVGDGSDNGRDRTTATPSRSTGSTPGLEIPTRDALLEDATRATGLRDFGSATFVEGLDRLLGAIAHDGGFTQEGIDAMAAVVRRRLINRLRIEAWYRDHPSSAGTVAGPVSITGLPRTGTTALANMLSLDGQFRCLRMWEQSDPLPPPTGTDDAGDPRRLAMIAQFDQLLDARPEQRAMHLYDVDATVEDLEVIGLEFKAQQYIQPLYEFHRWWRDTDMVPTYAYHRRVVELLGSASEPDLWLFKSPHQLFHLDAWVAAYPDTRFVMTHRDPARSVPSYVSFVTSLFPPGSLESTDLERFGRHTSAHLRIGLERALDVRARIGEDRFVDVHQVDLVRDPFGTVERVYGGLGLELRPDVRDEMVRWHEINHAGAWGVHAYTPEQYGLSTAQLHDDYASYLERFAIVPES